MQVVDTQAPTVTQLVTPVYTTVASASATITGEGSQVIISAKKNNSKNTGAVDGWEVHCVVPSFVSSIASLGDWAETVNTVLLTQARETLKQWRIANPLSSTIPLSLFTANQLREDFLSGGDSGSYTKEELEKVFCMSATWLRISTSDSFKSSSQYRTVADVFKNKIVSLAGRSHGSLTDTDLDKIFAKIEESDLVTPFGAYICKRIQKIRKDREEGGNDALDIDAL